MDGADGRWAGRAQRGRRAESARGRVRDPRTVSEGDSEWRDGEGETRVTGSRCACFCGWRLGGEGWGDAVRLGFLVPAGVCEGAGHRN